MVHLVGSFYAVSTNNFIPIL